MTRENVLTLLEASGKKLEECEGECEVDTGRRLGADYVVSGELYRIGPLLRLGARLHSTRSGTLLAAAQAEGKDLAEVDGALREACKRLLARFSGQPARTSGLSRNALKFWTDQPDEIGVSLLAANGSFGCDASF